MANSNKASHIDAMEITEKKFFEWWARTNPHIGKYEFTKQEISEDGEFIQGPSFDVKARSGNSLVIIEVKVRKEKDKPNDWFLQPGFGPFLEKLKCIRLNEAKAEILTQHQVNVIPFYLTFTTNGCLLYRICDTDRYRYEDWLLPKDKGKNKSVLVKKPVTKLKYPEEQILFSEDNMNEDTWLHLNSTEE